MVTAAASGPEGSSNASLEARTTAKRAGVLLLMVLPGALTIYLAFSSGGFFPVPTAVACLVLSSAIAIRIATAAEPFADLTRSALIVGGALLLLAGWTLASSLWSESPGRSFVEFDRALLYAQAFVLFALLPRDTTLVRWGVRSVAAGMVVVCAAAFASRTLPEIVVTSPGLANDRLSYPLSYWNGLGLFAGIATLLLVYLTTSDREPLWVRSLAAAATPLTAATALLTFSRGGLAAAAIAIAAYVAVAWQRRLLTGLLIVIPTTGFALVRTYQADLLATVDPTTDAALGQGRDLAAAIGIAMSVALVGRAALGAADRLLDRISLGPQTRRRLVSGVAGVAIVATVSTAVMTDAIGRATDLYDDFVADDIQHSGQVRDRLTQAGNDGRLGQWDVALSAFAADPLTGGGAGTYEFMWFRDRPAPSEVVDAHSLYVEVLGELGLIGLLLVVIVVGGTLISIALGVRSRDRALYAAVAAAFGAWALHAGFDWDWELSATSLWAFCLAGLAVTGRPLRPARMPAWSRPASCAAVVALCVVPLLVIGSETRLATAEAAFLDGDCEVAERAARSSRAFLPVRAEPHYIIGYCEAETGDTEQATRTLARTVALEPQNWRSHYALAIALALDGVDPRAQSAAALRLNPFSELTRTASAAFRGAGPRQRPRIARGLQLPLR
jgi:O-antigen ligase